jgi:uncharacterized protein YcaQ
MAVSKLQRLRLIAIAQSLFPPAALPAAIRRLGFVQADPIRSPARAQDLILRHRVNSYRAGDLERHYATLGIEEDILYAYGFVPRTIWRLLHPRNTRAMTDLEARVLEKVRKSGVVHPRDLEEYFGSKRVVNAWGGYSKATTHALERLQYRGLLRVARREDGIRLYEAAPAGGEPMAPEARLRTLVLAVARLLTPVPERTLLANLARFRNLGNARSMVSALVKEGELETETVDGVTYLLPHSIGRHEDAPAMVRFLAPFDPLIWDRSRFEHFWAWRYRFEAYTPAAKRQRGYYAMPLLWGDNVIGWANARVEQGLLNVATGFVDKRPKDAAFRTELDAEIARLQRFLDLSNLSRAATTTSR